MFKGWLITLPLILIILMTANSSAEMQRLSDSELAYLTAQNGMMSTNIGNISLSRNIYIEKAKLESLYLTNKHLAERMHYFTELDNLSAASSEKLAEQLEMSLVTFSTQLASTITFSSLFPLLGLPIGVGASAVPEAFNVIVTGVKLDAEMNITVRE